MQQQLALEHVAERMRHQRREGEGLPGRLVLGQQDRPASRAGSRSRCTRARTPQITRAPQIARRSQPAQSQYSGAPRTKIDTDQHRDRPRHHGDDQRTARTAPSAARRARGHQSQPRSPNRPRRRRRAAGARAWIRCAANAAEVGVHHACRAPAPHSARARRRRAAPPCRCAPGAAGSRRRAPACRSRSESPTSGTSGRSTP